MNDTVRYQLDGHVATITYHRPERLNAIEGAMRRGLNEAARAIKEVAVRTADLPMTDAIRFGETMRRVVGATEDAAEGRAATLERRDPRWRGR